MSDPTSLLYGLSGYRVLEVVEAAAEDPLRVVIEPVERAAACPSCGVFSSAVKDRPVRRLRDLPCGGRVPQVWLRQRRLLCREPACGRRSFTQTSEQVPARARTTTRLRGKLADAIARSNRPVSGVAAEYGVSWPTAHRALVAAAAKWLPPPDPIDVLGIDETRTRRVRWYLEDAVWRRSDPWMTSFVDADPAKPGRLLGLAPGRSGACVADWLAEQSKDFRDGIRLVVIDPSAPYACGVRKALPNAQIAVDHWHLVKLGNDAVTRVRQRLVQQRHQRRGRKTDLSWSHRQLLLTAGERLTGKQLQRLQQVFADDDPTNELGAAWGCKEHLRHLLASPPDPRIIRARLWAFYSACELADMPETTRLATTIEQWWQPILTFLLHRVTNARTEGFNRVIKQVKRAGCGYRNMDNYERRILTHIAVTRAA